MTVAITGKCLCGAVSYSFEAEQSGLDACHCHMCRRWSGGPFLCLGHDGAVTVQGQESITVYKSSEWGERAFCKTCGTALYWHLQDGAHYAFSAGTIEDQSALSLTRQLFIEQKPGYYEFANDTRKVTGEELFAAFNSGETS